MQGIRNYYHKKPSDKERKAVFEPYKTSLKKALDTNKSLQVAEPYRYYTVDHFKRDPYDFYLEYFEAIVISRKAIEVLYKILNDSIEKYWVLSKESTSDAEISGVIDLIFKGCIEHFKKIPTTYRHNRLTKVLLICADYCNIPHQDLYRIIAKKRKEFKNV